MKAKEKDDLSTPCRSSRIARAENTNTKKSSRCKKASKTLGTGHHFTEREKTLIKNLNQWIRKGMERERKGSLCFRLVKISTVLQLLRQKFAKFKILCRQTSVKCFDGNRRHARAKNSWWTQTNHIGQF